MAKISLDNICAELSQNQVLTDVSLKIGFGELVALVGPNGAGKTSLMRAALGALPVSAGTVKLNAKPIADYSQAQRARQIAYLPQIRPLAWPLSVRDTVALGRYAWGSSPGKLSPADAEAVDRAMTDCGIAQLAARRTDELSGGELARVHCARALAAHTPLLFVDEPVAALDPKHQFRIMTLLRQFVDDGGGALVILHDLSLAARFADRLVWLKNGVIDADGPPRQTLTADRLHAVFDISAQVTWDNDIPAITIAGPAAN